jgi:hypothetical protein
LFLAGILIHRLFCVRTTIDKLIFSTFYKSWFKMIQCGAK